MTIIPTISISHGHTHLPLRGLRLSLFFRLFFHTRSPLPTSPEESHLWLAKDIFIQSVQLFIIYSRGEATATVPSLRQIYCLTIRSLNIFTADSSASEAEKKLKTRHKLITVSLSFPLKIFSGWWFVGGDVDSSVEIREYKKQRNGDVCCHAHEASPEEASNHPSLYSGCRVCRWTNKKLVPCDPQENNFFPAKIESSLP